jgi:peptidyl-prolyl cis-trans isomerase SurA
MIKSFRFILIALSALLLSPAVFAKSSQQSLDGIAAEVNDSIITQSEVNIALNATKAEMNGANLPIPPASVLQQKVLQQVIDRKLQLIAADQAGIKISDKQLDETIDNIAKQNGVTADILYSKVATQNLSRAEYRKEIREELTIQQIQQQQVASKVLMTPDEVKNFMRTKEWQTAAGLNAPSVKEYRVEDLIVLVPDSASAQDIATAKTRAESLMTEAKQSANYNGLIKPEDKSVEVNDLGWRKLEELPSAFANQVAASKKGNIIGPIQAGNGFHVIHLVDMRQEKNATASGPAPTEKEAQQMVYQRKFADALKKWIAKLHNQAVINVHPGSVG